MGLWDLSVPPFVSIPYATNQPNKPTNQQQQPKKSQHNGWAMSASQSSHLLTPLFATPSISHKLYVSHSYRPMGYAQLKLSDTHRWLWVISIVQIAGTTDTAGTDSISARTMAPSWASYLPCDTSYITHISKTVPIDHFDYYYRPVELVAAV